MIAPDRPALPTFLVIGAMKAGTTSLHSYLSSHPDVFMATPKELDFFLDDGNWRRGVDWYRAQFAAGASATARGEASPSYTKYPAVPHVPERIAAVVSDVRLVYLVRDPIERVRSHWQQNAIYENERRTLSDAVLEDPHYLACSSYAMQLDQYLAHFDRDRVLVITTEDLQSDRATTVARVLAFVGVEPDVSRVELAHEAHRSTSTRARGSLGRLARRLPGHEVIARVAPRGLLQRWHTTTSREIDPDALVLSDEARRHAESVLAPDVRRLRAFLGDDFDGWGLA